MYSDTTFNMGGKYIVTTVMVHPLPQNRVTGGPALLQMASFLTPSLKQKAYEEFGWFLRQSVGKPEQDWKLRHITDGETALYNAFLYVFDDSEHALCAIHSRDGVSRKICNDFKDIDAKRKRLIMFDIYGFEHNENNNHSPGLIDSETVELFRQQLESCESRWKHDKFFEWFVKYQKTKFEGKLILPERQKSVCRRT
ncbi:hypothetical protein RvY_10407-1 [Ramazzottius varieornatus]|uniref:MULE transposase domain-containing protein n=1 Tax=Ramazzottius varieornatus TaxID=947166 RepID=A0A1D1VCM7_RAMVA|nr:hypothetical protein RvY_10407-1 [Ramazzottius varieornatus]